MRRILRFPAVRLVCWYLAFTLSGLAMLPAAAHASFISPSENTLGEMDADAISAVREALEEGVLTEKLTALGLSADEISSRIEGLTADERQAVLADLDKVQAGGNGAVTLLIVLLLVILILKLMDKEIIIK